MGNKKRGTVAIISPHPDDAELGMGGTINLFSKNNYSIFIIDLTDGEPTPYGTKEKRKEESKKAAEILGVTERITLNYPNRFLSDNTNCRKEVAGILRKIKPKTIFLPYFEDAHPDHIACASIGLSARFYSKLTNTDIGGEHLDYLPKLFYYFCTHLKKQMPVSFTVDISKTFRKKMESIKSYRSQFLIEEKGKEILKYIENTNRGLGYLSDCQYAEGFHSQEMLKISFNELL